MHALDATALFYAVDEDDEIEDDTDGGGGGDEQPEYVDVFESRGSQVDEGDPDAIAVTQVRYLPFLKGNFD
jgi:hypothetical protein